MSPCHSQNQTGAYIERPIVSSNASCGKSVASFLCFLELLVVARSSKSFESCKTIDYDDNVDYGTHGATYGGIGFSMKQEGKEDSSPAQQEPANENNDDFPTTSKN
jgi:hypothetical protein